MFGFEGTNPKAVFLDSSMVEHSAVNRVVVGSSPTRGVFLYQKKIWEKPKQEGSGEPEKEIWLHGQAVKTSPFHGGNTGSIPVGVITREGLRTFSSVG